MTPTDHLVDWTLGELPEPEARALRRELETDPSTAIEAAEVKALVEDMRTLTVNPSGRIELALRYAIARRNDLRSHRSGQGGMASVFVRVAAVAAAVLVGLLLWQHRSRGSQLEHAERAAVLAARALPAPVDPAPPRVAAPEIELPGDDVLSAASETFQRSYAQLDKLSQVDRFTRLVTASNELAILRLEFMQRYSRKARRQSIASCGGRPDLEDRVQALATALAQQALAAIHDRSAGVEEMALAVRALLASGSTRRLGHHRAVSAALEFLEERVGALEGGELASALAALTDYAVVSQGRAANLVARHTTRLAMSMLQLPASRPTHDSPQLGDPSAQDRSELLKFTTSIAALADAGHVLRLAPAFGVHPTLARRARLLAAAHLEERLTIGQGERPAVVAALLYGFGDLVQRRELDNKLLLWGPAVVAGEDLVALHHLAWSQFPPRPGWAEFQRQLRGLATLKTPHEIRDTSALLLALSMNFAAPGVREVLQLPAG